MIYFICWAIFIVAIVLATILTAVMGGRSSGKREPAEAIGAIDGDEVVGEAEMDPGDFASEPAEQFAEPAADDFAEFENEFK